LAGRRYRSKLELLRDFLAAAQVETVKTRIMNRANLNQVSFARYKTLAESNELLKEVGGGYALTPQAESLLRSINEVLSKAADLRVAVGILNHAARSGGYRLLRSELAPRSIEQISIPENLGQVPEVSRRTAILRED
jgi:predicted transcriptional regulator